MRCAFHMQGQSLNSGHKSLDKVASGHINIILKQVYNNVTHTVTKRRTFVQDISF